MSIIEAYSLMLHAQAYYVRRAWMWVTGKLCGLPAFPIVLIFLVLCLMGLYVLETVRWLNS